MTWPKRLAKQKFQTKGNLEVFFLRCGVCEKIRTRKAQGIGLSIVWAILPEKSLTTLTNIVKSSRLP